MTRRPRGTGSIRKIDATTHELRYAGRSRRIKGGAGAAKTALRAFVAEVDQDKSKSVPSGTTSISFLDLLRQYAENAHVTTRTRQAYEAHVRVAESWFKPTEAADGITTQGLRMFFDWERLKAGRGAETLRHRRAFFSGAFQEGLARGQVKTNPVKAFRLPTVRVETINPPQPEEVQKLIANADGWFKLFIEMAVGTGARRGELLALKWTDVRGSDLVIERAVRTATGVREVGTTKTGNTRRIKLPASLVERLEDERTRSTSKWIFASPVGDGFRTPGAVSQLFRNLRSRVGVDCRLHDLRHFHATALLSSGIDVRTVAGRLGHASPSITLNVYAAFVPSADEKAAAVLEHLF